MALLRDVINNASTIEPNRLTVTVDDLLFVHSVLYRVTQRVKDDKRQHNELMKKQVYRCFETINFDMPEIKDYPPEVQNYSLNLALPRQILIDDSDIALCKYCKALVTGDMTSETEVRKAYELPFWDCESCKNRHNPCDIRCEIFRTVQSSKYSKNNGLLLKRYLPKPPNDAPVLNYLEEALSIIPIISKDGDDLLALLKVFHI